jgi:phage gp45-like
VQTLILPDEAEQDIEEMEQYGYVKKLELKRGIEEKLITLTQKGIDEIDR